MLQVMDLKDILAPEGLDNKDEDSDTLTFVPSDLDDDADEVLLEDLTEDETTVS